MDARWIAVAFVLAAPARAQFGLSSLERDSGWVAMEDGVSAWAAPVEGWTFESHVLRRHGAAKPLTWSEVLSDFEIDFEWCEPLAPNPAWQSGRIVMRRDATGFALLGAQRIERETKSELPSFRAGPFELTPAQTKPGWHVTLAPGDAELRLRNMRLRDRTKVVGKEVELFDGKTLKGWSALGDAKYTVQDGELVGEVGGGAQSFLRTEASFGDFILEVDVKNELPGNSGIQVRSHENEQKRLFGYQLEIDPSPRAWSGGLYDEARRGWLDDLSDNVHGRAAFKSGEWNRYRIECIGPWIRAWVNDVPTADYLDAKDLEGVIGLQVHSGKDTRVRWRNFRLRELGHSSWKAPGSFFIRTHSRGRGIALPDTGGVAGFHCASRESNLGQEVPVSLISIDGSGWSMELREKDLRAQDVQVFCYPPRFAIELDGKRVPCQLKSKKTREPAFELGQSEPDTIKVHIGLEFDKSVIIHEAVLARD